MSYLITKTDPNSEGSRTNRRGSARSPLFMMVRAADAPDPMWAWDIGLGGMQCRSRKMRWPGTYLDLSFTLPETGEALKAGGQVLSFDEKEEEVSIGVRFCMLSVRAQRSIYRFLDRRRQLWEKSETLWKPAEAVAESDTARSVEPERPFEPLLREAYASIQAQKAHDLSQFAMTRMKEMQQLGFVRTMPLGRLPRISQLVRSA